MLSAKPQPNVSAEPGKAGLYWLETGGRRPAALFVPTGAAQDGPVPLVVLLHGAGAGASDILPLMQAAAEARGFLLLVPQSVGPTWDMIMGRLGPDVAALDRALASVFESYRVDPQRIAVAGFSDGASYALSIGLANGELFGDVIAFSPGFVAPVRRNGQPRIFMSHGDGDPVLPIDRCSRRIAPELRAAGYDLDYREFAGGHVVPTDLVQAALDRALQLDGRPVPRRGWPPRG